MKKKRKAPNRKEDKPVTLGDMINEDVVKHLREAKQRLKEEEEEKELMKHKEMLKQKEKSKTFEDLLNESNLDWREFK